ncbi:MAG: PstS family phosphate ABC transporter substrate-binding protein [Methanosarcinales archaeon]|nr:MAG: PstS family phosphate ABC transporter substrate-binding protein [Methanosarcinales archaeon]
MMHKKIVVAIVLMVAFVFALGCTERTLISIDGSSTVFPISEAVAEEFQLANPGIIVTVGVSGTGGGFKKFCAGEIDIADASRPIKQSEIEACEENGIEYIEFVIAYDGLSVVVNPGNYFVDYLTIEELRQIWEPESTVSKWSNVRPEWPDEKIFLAGADTDSGSFDYFTETVIGESGASRSDYTASADDNMLVQAVSGQKGALAYFGYAYYTNNKNKLKVVPIDNGGGCITPSIENITSGEYPLSRPLFIYVNAESLKRLEFSAFVEYYLGSSKPLVEDVGYVAVSKTEKDEMIEMLAGYYPENQ